MSLLEFRGELNKLGFIANRGLTGLQYQFPAYILILCADEFHVWYLDSGYRILVVKEDENFIRYKVLHGRNLKEVAECEPAIFKKKEAVISYVTALKRLNTTW